MPFPIAREVSATGRFTPGVKDASAMPITRWPGQPIVVYGHGGGSEAAEMIGEAGLPEIGELCAALAGRGFIVVAPTTTLLWGNAEDQDLRADSVAWPRQELDASSGPIITVGASAGNAASLLFAAENQGAVAAHIGIIPLVDTKAIADSNEGGVQPSMYAALGNPVPDSLNPARRTGDLQFPQQLWWANNDPFSFGIEDYAVAVGAELHDVGPWGHSPAAVAEVDVDAVVAFAVSAVS